VTIERSMADAEYERSGDELLSSGLYVDWVPGALFRCSDMTIPMRVVVTFLGRL